MGTVVTLLFAVALLIPCLCASAAAMEADDSSGCCPETGQSEVDVSDHDGQDGDDMSDCCCSDPVDTCSSNDLADTSFLPQTTTSSFEENIQGPNTWWTPDLVATLWLVDRLADAETTSTVEATAYHSIRPDRSEIYLEHSILRL